MNLDELIQELTRLRAAWGGQVSVKLEGAAPLGERPLGLDEARGARLKAEGQARYVLIERQ